MALRGPSESTRSNVRVEFEKDTCSMQNIHKLCKSNRNAPSAGICINAASIQVDQMAHGIVKGSKMGSMEHCHRKVSHDGASSLLHKLPRWIRQGLST